MKFTRRPDLAPQTRIDIVMLAWLHQGVYGKMTEIAQCYQISRTFLYQLLFLANLQLETLFSDEKRLFQKIIGTSNSSSCCYAWKGHARC